MTLVLAVIKSLRPWQWSKNALLFGALFFSGNLFDPILASRAALGFVLFCIVSGSVYLLNDILDAAQDRLHPHKSKRPIASGMVSARFAAILFILLFLSAAAAAMTVDWCFFLILISYFLLISGYSFGLKRIVIIDTLIIAAGFLLRVGAGAAIIGATLSTWILLCTFFLALFIALNKRRYELTLLGDAARGHRSVLAHYSPYLLDQMIAVATSSTVICYAMYTRSEETVHKFGTTDLMLSVPFVVYGIFRYLYLVHQEHEGGAPEMTIVQDVPLLVDILLWILVAGLAIYT